MKERDWYCRVPPRACVFARATSITKFPERKERESGGELYGGIHVNYPADFKATEQ